jgi:arylsulfatase A
MVKPFHLALLLLALFAHSTSALAQDSRRPNVLLILADDQGTVDVGAWGTRDIQTPALDRLAGQGLRFTQFYAAAPVCSPSRAAFLSGLTPQHAGLNGNVDPNNPESGLPPSTVTIAEHFHAQGYATAQIGKWHLGHSSDRQPTGQGFDFGFGHLGGCIDNYSHFFYWNGPNRHDLVRNGVEEYHPGDFFPDLCLDEAMDWIRGRDEQPWLMYFALNLPHYPYQGDPKWLERYAGMSMPRREYAAFVSTMDERIGALLAFLEEEGIRDETLVIFQSDHGHSTEQRAFYGGGSAGPHRGAKFSLLEGGIRVPAILSGPGVAEDEVRDQMATACDWFPTLCTLAGIPQPKHKLDGRDLAALLASENAPSPHEHFFWKNGGSWALRSGKWKLIWNANDTSDGRNWQREPGLRLYDLSADPGESTDLAAEQRMQVKRLRKLAQKWDAEIPFELAPAKKGD